MVQKVRVRQAEFAADAAEAEVARAENQPGHAGVHERAGAHDAGFDGDVEGGVFEAVVVQDGGAIAEGLDFGVSRGVRCGYGGVAAAADVALLVNQYGADGDLSGHSGGAGQLDGLAHETGVPRAAKCIRMSEAQIVLQ